MRSWSTLQPGETFSCVGCHEGKNAAPPSYARPTEAMNRGVRDLEPFAGLSGGFSFPRHVQPILDRSCVRCHGDRSRKPTFGGGPSGRSAKDISRRLIERGASWRFTTTRPPRSWRDRGFDDSAWREARSPFGRRGTPGATVSTPWHTSDIWLRTTVEIVPTPGADLALEMIHDEDVEVFVNGVPAARAAGYITSYRLFAMDDGARDTVAPGANTIAVHCRQTLGGQLVDVSLVEFGKAKPLAGDLVAFSLRGDGNTDRRAKRVWSDAYLALTQRGRSNRVVNWISAQSIPPMLEPYHAGAARSGLVSMLERGHRGVELSKRELDVIKCWIDLLVPYCGSYTEAVAWSEAERRKYEHFAAKRAGMEQVERQNIEALLEYQQLP
jgi:hypothetical protein